MKSLSGLQRENRDLRSLIETSLLLNSPHQLGKLLDLIMRVSKKVMRAEAATLMLVDEEQGDLTYEVALGEKGRQIKQRFRLKMGQGVAGWVALHGKSVIVKDAAKDSRFYSKVDKTTGFKTRSILCVPLLVEGKVIGVLEAFNPVQKKSFDSGDLELFEVFSAQAAVAVAKARWHEKMLREQKLQQDLDVAREIQKNFLCKESLRFPQMRFFAKYQPAQTIGGDFFDCFSLGPKKVAVLLGDVSGKGIPAALYMVRTVTEFRNTVTDLFPDIATVISLLNQSILEQSTFGMFVTAVGMAIDFSQGKMFVSNAGHLPPLLFRKKEGKAQFMVRADQPPLGLMPGISYPATCHTWEPGDRLLLYTDGLTEARNKKQQEFGAERLAQIFAHAARVQKESGILPLIFDTIKHFNFREPLDDQTAVLVSF